MKYLTSILTLSLAILPSIALSAPAPSDLKGVVGIVVGLVNLLIYVIFALAFLVLVWGIMKAWIFNGGDSKSVEEGKKLFTAGLIGLVVMSSLWGIVYLVKASLFG